MKEMVYQAERKLEILHSGTYDGHGFAILNIGTHPTAYVECKLIGCTDYSDKRLDEVDVHGGFTFLREAYWDTTDKRQYLGWDYAHFGDYSGYMERYVFAQADRRWNTAEIFEEVKSVIHQLKGIEDAERKCDLEKEKDL